MRKYSNKKIKIDGFKFDSLAEGRHYIDLKLMLKSGLIENLEVHPRIEYYIGCKRIFTYTADFSFNEISDKTLIIHDVKGFETSTFRLKWKIVRHAYPEVKMFKIVRGKPIEEIIKQPRETKNARTKK